MMKNQNIKWVCYALAVMVVLCFFYSQIVELRVQKFNGVTIVLDAGHGGRDGGSVGKNGTIEKEINLEYVLLLTVKQKGVAQNAVKQVENFRIKKAMDILLMFILI